jgi:hypothetical protein
VAPPSALAPLEAAESIIELQPARTWVVLPAGAREPRPIVLFWDGVTENTAAACKDWFALAGQVPFVLCKRALDGPTEPRAAAELRQALGILKQRFGPHVASGGLVFVAGGSVVPASLQAIREEPSFFSRVALISEEHVPWSATLAAVFGKAGGERVLIACRSEGCHRHTAHTVSWLERNGAEARAIEPGKTLGGGAAGIDTAAWHWLVEGDRRYRIGGTP